MSTKLDKSLDEILVNRRQGVRNRRRNARSKAANAAVPVGGVKKTTKSAKPAGKAIQNGHPISTESKIMVSGLPADVNEANIKEYFSKSAGPVKRVMLTYNQNGTSRGIASIVFSKRDTAAKAAKELNGLLVDGRPMKVVVDASHAPEVPAPKPLGDRVAQGKSKPKPATNAKAANTAAGKKGRGGRRPGARTNRPKPKTAEELDAEMDDYFITSGDVAPANVPAAANVAPQQAAGDDVGMAEIS
ncbi:Putative RNA annealing protein Yra1 [Aspergillus calidoustus]|uniref:Putative RNA annealing protein Yra1 n=1 Tax=Aspergillus calidoustus TaxID=454130 RepID=A0A0U5GRU0_ASPCI|nr:Putative RNA annealing protein Yra1 [Aspergillus calidoustus]